jgi:RHH-type proline utilization regulon transcriptional repressor/proline dehydrogenase/delta 1-pyrroline-5-carboxylate dehydrogenase
VVCISPWNFPLAIFTGQLAAALVAGNPVLAKPAEETPLVAAESVRLLHEAGVPEDALQLICGDGAIGAALVGAEQVAGVMFTGSTEVARLIQKQLAQRLSPDGTPIPLIAETGGQNAMIVDSSALAEQVVGDVIASAFDSAGQRCSALRILCLQEEVADRTLEMLRGALRELRIGGTERLAMDIGPVITEEAKAGIETHIAAMQAKGHRVERLDLPEGTAHGSFVAPTIIELDTIADLGREVFGPVLHVIRYRRDRLDALIDAINATGYGLTFGLHTRLDATIAHVSGRVKAGNLYINRNVIGAVVGVQPFGGRGLSGTGPKAGGPLYLGRLVKQNAKAPTQNQSNPALQAFASWLEAHGEQAAAAHALACGIASPLGREEELPGPVGERNLYSLHPRGRILLRAASAQGLYRQIAAVLAGGCDGVVQGIAIPSDLPAPVAARLSVHAGGDLAGLLVEGDAAAVLQAQQDMAARPGAIVPVHVALQGGNGPAYDLDRLVEEVSISINTTAGGNASLMALA